MTSAPADEALRARFPGLDPGIAALLEAARAAALPPLAALSPDELRERVQGGDRLCAPGPDMLDVADVALPGGLRTRRYTPHRLRTQTALVWFHGGGWVTGTLDYSDGFCRRLADGLGCEVHSIDYRLAPEHRFPAAVEDALTAVRCIGGGRQVVVAGDSAGGNLAAVCAQQVNDARAGVRQARPDPGHVPSTRVCGQLLVYPVLDSDTTRSSYLRNAGLVLGPAEMTWFFDHYVPVAAERASPRLAPLRAPDLRGLPPAVIAVAGHDPLYDEGVAYAAALRAAGVPVELLDFPPLVHGFLRFTGPVPAAADAAAAIVAAAARLFRD
jgi:acetyl esterase